MHIQKYYEGNLGLLSEADRTMYINSQKEDVRDTVSRSRIDFTMTQYNYNLCPHDQYTSKEILNKHKQIRKRNIKNTGPKKDVVFGSVIISVPKDYDGDLERFFEAAYEGLKDKFGITDDDVVSAYVHMDENRPHMHFYFLPIFRDNDTIKMNWDKVCPRSLYVSLHSDLEKRISEELGIGVHLLNNETLGIGNSQYLTHEQKDLLIELDKLRKERAAEYADAPGYRDQIRNINKDIKYYEKQGESNKVEALKEKLRGYEAKLTKNKAKIKSLTTEIHEIEEEVSTTKQNQHQKMAVNRIIEITNESQELYEARETIERCNNILVAKEKELEKNQMVIDNLNKEKEELIKLISERKMKQMNKKSSFRDRMGMSIHLSKEEYEAMTNSIETKEINNERQKQLNDKEQDLCERELNLRYDKEDLDYREARLKKEIEKGIEDKMPEEIKKRQQFLVEQEELFRKREEELRKREKKLKEKESKIANLINNIAAFIMRKIREFFEKYIAEKIEKDKKMDVVSQLAARLQGETQSKAIEIVKDVPVDDEAKKELRGIGIKTKDYMTVGDVMVSAESKDIRLELKKRGVDPSDINADVVVDIRRKLISGVPEDKAFDEEIQEIEEELEEPCLTL